MIEFLSKEPAKALREALKSGASLKDRLSIKLENDVRKGEVKFDHWFFYARVSNLFKLYIFFIVILIMQFVIEDCRFTMYHRIIENYRFQKHL